MSILYKYCTRQLLAHISCPYTVLFLSLNNRNLRCFSKSSTMDQNRNILCLFDVDGTLTPSRRNISENMKRFLLDQVRPRAQLAVVGGSDYNKIFEQMGGLNVLKEFYVVCSENGLVVHKGGEQIYKKSIQEHVGEETLQKFINFSLRYMSEIELPVKRGTFIEFRTGLVNVCPVGRSCSQSERDQFEIYDKEHNIRSKFVQALQNQFPDLGLVYSIGGQISFDVFPQGWDKTYSLRHIPNEEFTEIHFFGDKADPGGNDYELLQHARVIGHKVTSPDDTKAQLTELLRI